MEINEFVEELNKINIFPTKEQLDLLDNYYNIVVEENNAGDVIKSSGTVCTVTFKKLGTVEDGASAAFSASVIDSLTYGKDGASVEIADGTATVSLDKVETTTKKPTNCRWRF